MIFSRAVAAFACVIAGLVIWAAPAAADPAPVLPEGPILKKTDPEWPNDPNFARCDEQDPVTGCTDSEQWNLFGKMDGLCKAPGGTTFTEPRPSGGLPCWARNATDPEGASGINVTGAWAQGNLGRDEVLIAYIEGGVNYSSNKIKEGLNAIFINKGELPFPQGWDGQDLGRHDFDGNGRFDIRDFAKDPRVNPPCPSGVTPADALKFEEGTTRGCAPGGKHEYIHKVTVGGAATAYLSPEDLIAVFGHCKIENGRVSSCPSDGRFDNDGNGYPNDVSGWNAYHNNNDPQTDDLAYGHASGLMAEMVAQPNDGFGRVGNCRECRVIPVKSGAESVGKADGLAPAITYAVDIGAKAMATVVVSYAYSSALREAVKYAVDNDVLMSMDSNDFDSMDHTDGHLFDDVFPGNGIVQDRGGKDVQTFRARSNVTSYGTHALFNGGETTTSGATPFQAAFLGMVQSAAMNAVDENKYPRTLTPNEVKQVLINTSSEIVPQRDHPDVPNQWPGNPDSKTDATHTNWSTQYGYGRPNIGKATKLIMDGKVPPTVDIDSPSWYKYVDPTKQKTLQVKGSVQPSAWGSNGIEWTLEWALGADPKDSDFKTVSTGKAGKTGVLGTINLKDIPAGYATKAPANVMPPTGPEQYTVSIRLRARDGNGLKGEDRRSIGARADKDLVDGFPKSIGTEMSSAPTFADIQGRGQLDLVFGTYDGVVNAIGPDGKQAKNFPLRTRELRQIDDNMPQGFPSEAYKKVTALREARDPISGIAIGDLEGKGDQSVVATTTSGWVYAWSTTTGKLRAGFPAKPDPKYDTMPVPTPPSSGLKHRSPTRGNWSAPALANLQGNGKLSILMSSFDGHVYAWQPDGKAVPGWPVEVKLPSSIRSQIADSDFIRDAKLMMTPAVGDVLGKGTDQVFLPSFECDKKAGSTWVYGIQSDGNKNPGGAFMPGWPATMASMAGCYSESIDFVQEGGNAATLADFDGSGQLRIAITGVTGFPAIYNPDGSIWKNMQPGCTTPTCSGIPPYYQGDSILVGVTGQSAAGDMTGDGLPNYVQTMAGGITLTAALDEAGQAALPHVFDVAWDPVTGKQLNGFPTDQDGFPFYSSPVIANLSSDNTRSMISANDSYWIHARGPDGKEAPGFPKWTGQWTSFGGVVGDPKLNGKQYLAYGTREGELFLWKVGGKAEKNDQWWHYRHDEHNSGRHGNDTRPPAGVKVKVNRTKKKAVLRWKAAGNNGVSNGKVSKIEVYRSKKAISIGKLGKASKMKAPKIVNPGKNQSITLKLGKKQRLFIAIRSQDAAGNWSALSVVKVTPYKKSKKLIKKQIKKCKKQFKKQVRKAKKRNLGKKKIKQLKKKRNRCVKRAKRS